MNIFVLDRDPVVAAKLLYEYGPMRANKMIIESIQMLSTAIRFHKPYTDLKVWHTAYVNHPCTRWARQTRENYDWLLLHLVGLMTNYKERYNKDHPSGTRILPELYKGLECIPYGELTPFVNCAKNEIKGLDFSHINNVHIAYNYYLSEQIHLRKGLGIPKNSKSEQAKAIKCREDAKQRRLSFKNQGADQPEPKINAEPEPKINIDITLSKMAIDLVTNMKYDNRQYKKRSTKKWTKKRLKPSLT